MSYGKCRVCNTNEGIVYSGVDAFMLECIDDIEQICYSCAGKRLGFKTRSNK